jgi:DNA phosphorothioation-associated putative methyltransferase
MGTDGKIKSVGKRVGGALYVHQSSLDHISNKEMVQVKRALDSASSQTIEGKHRDWNVVRISADKVAFLEYEAFDEAPFPELKHSMLVDLLRDRVRHTDYSKRSNRPILHRKELLVTEDYPSRPSFMALTKKLEDLGVFYDTHRIGFREHWGKRLSDHGIVINGYDVEIKQTDSTEGVDRHKTALTRYQLSQPVKLLIRHSLISKETSIFDYGCGQGDDLNGLLQGEHDAKGWDPHFAPDAPFVPCDVVNLGFVLNVIEDPKERTAALKKAWNLTKGVLSIAVMPPSGDAIEHSKPFGDGFLTTRGTFQKYFTQEQLREYIRRVLGEGPIAVASGIFFVFRDEIIEQTFLLERHNRHRYQAVTLRPNRERPLKTTKPLKSDTLRPQLEQLYQEILDHGRFLSADELPEELMSAFQAERVSLQRAEQYCRDELIDTDLLERAQQDRREDLLVYFALEMFSGRQPYRQLQKGLKADIRSFFDSHGNAQVEARNLLFSTGDAPAVRQACEEFSDEDLGYILNGEQLIIHSSVLDKLPPILRCYIGCAGVLYGDISSADLIKIHIGTGKLTLQIYDDFSRSLPRITQRVKINMRAQAVRVFNSYDDRTQYLFMKSLYIPDDFENFQAQSKFDQALQKLNLFDFSNYGPDAKYFDETLHDHGFSVEEFELQTNVIDKESLSTS